MHSVNGKPLIEYLQAIHMLLFTRYATTILPLATIASSSPRLYIFVGDPSSFAKVTAAAPSHLKYRCNVNSSLSRVSSISLQIT